MTNKNQHMSGLTFKITKDITKHDFIKFCESLNNDEIYKEFCNFTPLRECGLKYNFYSSDSIKEKCILFHQDKGYCRRSYKKQMYPFIKVLPVKWPTISNEVMTEWLDNDEILFRKYIKINTTLKAEYLALPFTYKEIEYLEPYFNKLGLKRYGKYPIKRSFKIDIF